MYRSFLFNMHSGKPSTGAESQPMGFLPSIGVTTIIAIVVTLVVIFIAMKSIYRIPAGYNGWVTKSFGKKIENGGFLALNKEAGIQPDPIQNGWRFKLWPLFKVAKEPLVQIPAGTVGVVISQVGAALDGTKSAVYKPAFGDFESVRNFINDGGQQGVQRHVLLPGATRAIHPYAFIVVVEGGTYGIPVNEDAESLADDVENLSLKFVQVPSDQVGVVTTLDGPPLEGGDIAGRIGGFSDILPTLDTGEALVVGDASLLPSRIRIDEPKNKPNSGTVNFWDEWQKPVKDKRLSIAVDNWRKQNIQ